MLPENDLWGVVWAFWLREEQPQNLREVSSQGDNRRDLRRVFRGETPGPGLRVARNQLGYRVEDRSKKEQDNGVVKRETIAV